MSVYLEDAQGKIVSNPINETNTKYPAIPTQNSTRDGNEHPIDYQYMYNDGEPVSNIDTDVYSSYRNTTEELRKKTESWNEAMEACLVPYAEDGMAMQPCTYVKDEDDEGNQIMKKVKALQYFFQDHPSNIGSRTKEYVFCTNKVRFKSDRHRRLIYDRKVHIMSTREDEDNKVKFIDVIRHLFFTKYNGKYWSLVRDLENSAYTTEDHTMNGTVVKDVPKTLLTAILHANTKFNDFSSVRRDTDACTLEVVLLDNNGDFILDEHGNRTTKVVETIDDLIKYPLANGQDIDTTVPSTVYNLYNLGWICASMVFLNGLAIEWTKTLISVDNKDVFVIVSGVRPGINSLLDDDKKIKMEYVHIPFNCRYIIEDEATNSNCPIREFINEETGKFDCVPFVINKNDGAIESPSNEKNINVGTQYDRVLCIDKNIVYTQVEMASTSDDKYEVYLADLGVQFNKSLRDFCNKDYRTKLKQFNFLGFEVREYINNVHYQNDYRHTRNPKMTFKNNDYKITWHPFNLMDIRFDSLYNKRRIFKIFYNTKVLYDQDNVLRIRNHQRLGEQYELYRQDITGNIITYMNEIYLLAKKDIGYYQATSEDVWIKGYKYHYVTPYECFLLFNAIHTFLKGDDPDPDHKYDTVTFDEFRRFSHLNVIEYPIHTKEHEEEDQGGGGSGGEGFDYVYPEYIYDDPDEEEDVSTSVTPSEKPNTVTETLDDKYLNYINGGFIIYDDDHKFFIDHMVTEEDIYDDQGHLKEEIREFWQSIVDLDTSEEPTKHLMDFLIPIEDARYRGDESHDKGYPTETNIFYMYNGDNRGMIRPYHTFMDGYALERVEESEEVIYDFLKLRFELAYINNMEEGATPVDELIYYFDNDNGNGYVQNMYPVIDPTHNKDRYTANVLNSLAYTVFKGDATRNPNYKRLIAAIVMLNYSSTFALPKSFYDVRRDARDRFIMSAVKDYRKTESNYDYRVDPRYFFNQGTIRDNKAIRVEDEWTLRRSLPEMFYWTLDKDKYAIDSMHLLDEVFDFTYGFDKDYEQNLKDGVNYILGYDADKLEASIKRSVVSMTKTGAQLKDYLHRFPAKVYSSTDSYKRVTFKTNPNGEVIVSISLERIAIHITDAGGIRIGTFTNSDYDNIDWTDSTIQLRYIGQENPTIEINTHNCTIKDVDRNFTVTFAPLLTRYNSETELVEFYDDNNTLLVTMNFDVVYDGKRLQMSRWNIGKQDNYVMIFKNGKLYEKYYTIHYTDIAFDVEMFNVSEDVRDDDMFEFVFFLNANNTVIAKRCANADDEKVTIDGTTYNRGIMCNTSIFDPENVQLLVSVMPKAPNDKWRVTKNQDTAYELQHTVYSYKQSIDKTIDFSPASDDNPIPDSHYPNTIKKEFVEDPPVNGLYRVTKQGGGEYLLVYDGKVPPNSDTIVNPEVDTKADMDTFIDYSEGYGPTDKGYTLNRTITPPFYLYLSSKRQFRYFHNTITNNDALETGFIMELPEEFNYCVKHTHVLVFKNGLLLPPTYYFLRPIVNTPMTKPKVVFNVPLAMGDKVDVFYTTNALYHTECVKYDSEEHDPSKNRYDTPDRLLTNGEYVPASVNHDETTHHDWVEEGIEPGRIEEGVLKDDNHGEYRIMGEGPDVIEYPEKATHEAQGYTNPDHPKSWRTNYIKFHSPLYAISSKHSCFVFLNGKKVRMDELTDISDTIMAIDTDYARENKDYQAVRLEVINHLDARDIIEQVFIHDGLNHVDEDARNQFTRTTKPNLYKDTMRIKSFALSELDNYSDRTLLDKILNDLADENLSKLFYHGTDTDNYNWVEGNIPKGPMTVRGRLLEEWLPTVVPIIEEEEYIEDDDELFIWHTQHETSAGAADGFANTIFYIGHTLQPEIPHETVRVPVEHDGEPTKALYATTFNRNKTLKTVVIPEGVERIE